MKTNTKPKATTTVAVERSPLVKAPKPEYELARSVCTALLGEDSFYENGVDHAARVAALVPLCKPEFVADIAVKCRGEYKLRHMPLMLVREMARLPGHRHLVKDTLTQIIQRPDEIAEFLAIYWKEKRQPLSAQVKRGLAKAFLKFKEHNLAKYDQDGIVKLRDALFLSHAKPMDADKRYTKLERKASPKADDQLTKGEALFKKIVDRKLETAGEGTWEQRLSGGEDKKVVFESMLKNKELGALAYLRNLRNMVDAGVEKSLMEDYAATMDTSRVLPFRFITAQQYAPTLTRALEGAMLRGVQGEEKIAGRTAIIVDVSGSMAHGISQKSDLTRIGAACGLAMLCREVCETPRIFTFSNAVVEIPGSFHGFDLAHAVVASQPHAGTYLGKAVQAVKAADAFYRIIVLTDEQSHDTVPAPGCRGYVINVAAYKHGVDYADWTHVSGWSEAVITYIRELEKLSQD